jgi:ribosomal protein L33
MNQQSEATKESKKKVLYQVENSPELYTRIKKAVTEKLKQQLNKYNPNINQVILHIEGDNQNRFTDDFKPAPTDEIKFNRVE